MHLKILLSLVSLLGSRVAAEFTWWFDQSCDQKLGGGTGDAMMAEAVATAILKRERMQRTRAGEQAAYHGFDTLFKFDLENPGDKGSLAEDFKREVLIDGPCWQHADGSQASSAGFRAATSAMPTKVFRDSQRSPLPAKAGTKRPKSECTATTKRDGSW
jgi:hypothetical protein